MLLAAAFGLAVSGNALAGPWEGGPPAVCVDAAPAARCAPIVEARFDAGFSPTALDKSKRTPVSLRTTMEFKTSDGSQLPALHQFEIDLDRHARLSLKDVPVCRPGNIDEPPIQQGCKEALVGAGKMVTDIRLPESTIPPVHSYVTVYNAGVRNGARTLIAVTNITVPTPTEVVITIVVERDHGRYGLKLVGSAPKIAGGAGSITRLGLRFHKEALSATCSDGRLQTGFGATFIEGTHLSGSVLRTCTPSH
ncbi:MAG TPA: hypothetical protein VFX44_06420 [Solirubrobacterales bacterium]|nr:hypothetical protein [Solirubrobacterales bacterium]